MHIFLSFDFYGAGNIGDDLMLKGFIDFVKSNNGEDIDISCISSHNLNSQRNRFPEVNWYSSKEIEQAIALSDVVIGVGDTPFQIKSGHWFIKKLINDVALCEYYNKQFYLVGVGAESELTNHKSILDPLRDKFRLIMTRDKFSGDLLVNDFGFDKSKIIEGSDLANLILEKWSSTLKPDRKYTLALNYYDEEPDKNDLRTLRRFLRSRKEDSIVYFSNESRKRKPFEYYFYRKMNNIFSPFKLDFYFPDYNSSSVYELINHFNNYDTVLTSRYHALLTASWAGCKVVALERSSKVNQLAADLNVPVISKPYSIEKITTAVESAKRVENIRLKKMYSIAEASMQSFINKVKSSY